MSTPMNPRQLPATAALERRLIDGWHTITSPDVPGLYLASQDYEKIAADVPRAIELLLQYNEGLRCRATMASETDVSIVAASAPPPAPGGRE